MSASGDLKSYRFRSEREANWTAFAGLLDKAERRGPRALSPEELLALPRLYRWTVSSLSTARAISLDRNLIEYLEWLCSRGYIFLYAPRAGWAQTLSRFFMRDWPAATRSAVGATLLAAAFMFGGAIIAFILVTQDTEWFYTFRMGFVDERTPEATADVLRATLYTEDFDIFDVLSVFASQLFAHNTMVALFAIALGFAFGIPTAILLFYNGLTLGAFVALYFEKGLGYELSGWLIIHGATELFAIILAGAAGFIIGGSIAFPGRRSRQDSAAHAGHKAGTLGMGIVVMLFLAALLEGFGRELINADWLRYTIGFGSLMLWMLYFYLPVRRS